MTENLSRYADGAKETLQILEYIAPIDSAQQAEVISELGKKAHQYIKEIEADLETINKESRDAIAASKRAIKAAEAVAAKSTGPLFEVRDLCRRLLEDWRALEKLRLAEATENLKSEISQGAGKDAVIAAAKKAAPIDDSSHNHFRVVYEVEIVDPLLLPREYLVPDLKALKTLARNSQGKAKVAGVRITATERAVFRK